MIIRRLSLVLLALLLAAPLGAQTVSGEFVSPSGEPVSSARVTLRDESGRTVHSALTDASGRFSLRAPAPGRYVVRAERIGFASTVSAAVTLGAGEQVTQRLVASGERVMLEAVVVEGQTRCALRPGVGEETSVVWGEVRKALDLVSANAEAPLARFSVELFEREIEHRSGAVTVDNRRRVEGMAHKPFVPVDPARLAAVGYIERDSTSLLYAAPDADVLLSDGFLEDHCFRLRTQGAPSPGLIGLAFEPARGRRVPDVQGVLWLDRATAELRLMEFEYTRAPVRGPRGVPGGRLEFQRLPDGRWITASWVVRMPVETQRPLSPMAPQGPRLVAIREVGGSVQPAGTLALASATPTAQPAPAPAAPTQQMPVVIDPLAAGVAASPEPGVSAQLPLPSTLSAETAPATRRAPPRASERRRRIGSDEVREARVSTGYDLVQALRPQWLRARGNDIMRVGIVMTPKGPIPGVIDESPVQLYVDNRLVGEVELLRSIPHADIEQIEYYDAVEAQQRFGIGHPQGAIHVIMKKT
jgi:hypothetical protein